MDGLATNVMREITAMFAASIAKGLTSSLETVTEATTPDLTKKWALQMFGLFLGFAVYLAIASLQLRTAGAVAERSPAEFVKGGASFVTFIVVAPMLIFIVNRIVQFCDGDVTKGWLDLFGSDLQQTLRDLARSLNDSGNWVDAIGAPLVIGFFGLIGVVALAAEFYVRDVALFLQTFYAVLVFAQWVRDRSERERLQRTLWVLAALCLFKVLAIVVMTIAVMLMGDVKPENTMLAGSILMLLVPYLTWVSYKKITGHELNASEWFRRAYRAGKKLASS